MRAEGFGMPLEQTLHLGRILQVPVGMALQPVARLVDGAALAGCR